MEQGQFGILAAAIKTILKRQKLTYLDLAERIGMSESGVKKLLTAADGSVNRLEAICDALGISLLDLVQAAAEDLPVQEVRLSQEIQEYFVANLESFHVFWKLVYEERPVDKLAAEMKLGRREFWKHLKQLDSMGLITLEANDRVILPKRGHLVWVGEGPLIDYLRQNWATALLKETIATLANEHRYLGLRYFRLTKESRYELLQAMRELVREFGNRSLRERLVQASEELVEVRLVTAIAPGGFV